MANPLLSRSRVQNSLPVLALVVLTLLVGAIEPTFLAPPISWSSPPTP
ncbi:MAG: hypothetical protein R3C69_16240 [Geminicoccaceae bacterium]